MKTHNSVKFCTFLVNIVSLLTLSGCNYITMTHTVGTGSGVVDETPTITSTIDPNVTVPISAVPSIPTLPELRK